MENEKPKYTPLEVIDGHYPGFIEIKGAPFKISIVTTATDLPFPKGMERRNFAAFMVRACNNIERVEAVNKELVAALETIEAGVKKRLAPGSPDTFMTLVMAMTRQSKLARAAIEKAKG